MRKTIYIVLIVMVLTACSTHSPEYASQKDYEAKIEQGKETSASHLDITGMEEMVNGASNIVVCTVSGVENFDDLSYVYTIEISDNIKGVIDERTLEVHSIDLLDYKVQYILFLDHFESALYGGKVYQHLLSAELNSEEIGDYITGGTPIKDLGVDVSEVGTLKDLTKFIQKNDDGLKTNKAVNDGKIIDAKDFDALVEQSEFICEIIPYKVIDDNPVVMLVSSKVSKNYKGKLKEDIRVFLPADTPLEQEYLVFLTETSEDVYEVNSSMSFIDKKDEKSYTKAIKVIDNEK